MDLDDVIEKLRSLDKPMPKPSRLPTESEVASAENKLGVEFPPDYHQFLLQASNVTCGTVEPCRVTPGAGRLDLVKMAREAWELGVSEDLLPFCESNGDYFCLQPDGQVVYWHHDGPPTKSGPTSLNGLTKFGWSKRKRTTTKINIGFSGKNRRAIHNPAFFLQRR